MAIMDFAAWCDVYTSHMEENASHVDVCAFFLKFCESHSLL
jgi:hypothetical protein